MMIERHMAWVEKLLVSAEGGMLHTVTKQFFWRSGTPVSEDFFEHAQLLRSVKV